MFLKTVFGDAGVAEKLSREAGCREKILSALRTLTPREEKVIRLRFGFGEFGLENKTEPKTLERVGIELKASNQGGLGCSKERMRQIEARALRKLRHPSRSNRLRELFPVEKS